MCTCPSSRFFCQRRVYNNINIYSKSGKSAVSLGKKSMTSAKSTKSVSSIQSRLLSAKKSSPDDNKPKKVIIKSPDLAKLNLRTEDLSFSGLTQLPHDTFTGEF